MEIFIYFRINIKIWKITKRFIILHNKVGLKSTECVGVSVCRRRTELLFSNIPTKMFIAIIRNYLPETL